ncbi:MAG TPA: PepSY domain-containing protein [Chondromyces sp.]|nr:PepSY domain-containing protein [Chondromyces sp.]
MLKNVLVVLMAACWVVGCAHNPQNEAMSSEPPEAEGEVEVPPEGALPLSEIIASLEVGAHVAIVEVEFEDGAWEIEYVVGDEVHEIHVDPMTGEALDEEADEPDEG